jgi:hypothetical protein
MYSAALRNLESKPEVDTTRRLSQMRGRAHRQRCNSKVRHFHQHAAVFPSHAEVPRHIDIHACAVHEGTFRLRLGAKSRAIEIGRGIESERTPLRQERTDAFWAL